MLSTAIRLARQVDFFVEFAVYYTCQIVSVRQSFVFPAVFPENKTRAEYKIRRFNRFRRPSRRATYRVALLRGSRGRTRGRYRRAPSVEHTCQR